MQYRIASGWPAGRIGGCAGESGGADALRLSTHLSGPPQHNPGPDAACWPIFVLNFDCILWTSSKATGIHNRYLLTELHREGIVVYELNTLCEIDSRIGKYTELTKCQPEKETRVYRELGNWSQFRLWLMEMRHLFGGDLIPMEWVAQLVGVTRAAVHKRIRTGKLTVFVFGMEEHVKGALGGTRTRMRQEFKYALLTEVLFWRSQLLEEGMQKEDQRAEKRRKKRFKP